MKAEFFKNFHRSIDAILWPVGVMKRNAERASHQYKSGHCCVIINGFS